MNTIWVSILLALTFLTSLVSPYYLSDMVTNLPDYPFAGRFFSGYLNVENPIKKLHYIFIESERDPINDPLVLWMNGGPGCSSLLGWSEEHGPAIFPEQSETLVKNIYSWNKVANMIYLESPAGVGFSYIDSFQERDKYIDDTLSAKENLEAVVSFFLKFPNMKNNDFYLSGESYAGIYVPTLASYIIDYNAKLPASMKIKLKGILVGNGVTDWRVDTMPASIEFGYSHGLYSSELYQNVTSHCKTPGAECDADMKKIEDAFSAVDIYDIYRKCISSKPSMFDNWKKAYPYTPWFFKQNGSSLSFLEGEPKKVGEVPPCTDSVGSYKYLNRPDVKKALNVKADLTWNMCDDSVAAHYQFDKIGSYPLYPKIIQNNVRILIYSGDTDLCVPFNGTEKWINNLKLKIISPWQSWRLGNPNVIAGYRTIYQGLTFVTLKGTGHMAPQWMPKEAFYMYSQFLAGKEL